MGGLALGVTKNQERRQRSKYSTITVVLLYPDAHGIKKINKK